MVSDRRPSQTPAMTPSFCPSPYAPQPALAGFPPKTGQIKAETGQNPANGLTRTSRPASQRTNHTNHNHKLPLEPLAPGTRTWKRAWLARSVGNIGQNTSQAHQPHPAHREDSFR